MAKRDEMLTNFLNNQLTSELSDMTQDELANISFANKSDNVLIEALKKMINSAVEAEDPKITTIKKVNQYLNDVK